MPILPTISDEIRRELQRVFARLEKTKSISITVKSALDMKMSVSRNRTFVLHWADGRKYKGFFSDDGGVAWLVGYEQLATMYAAHANVYASLELDNVAHLTNQPCHGGRFSSHYYIVLGENLTTFSSPYTMAHRTVVVDLLCSHYDGERHDRR